MSTDNKDTGDIPELISKSQRKREMHALRSLGEDLTKLPKIQLEGMNLPEDLYHAILEAQNIKTHGAHKRQLQYIGKILREIDVDPILAAMERLKQVSRQAVKKFQAVEIWRDRLLTEGDAVVSEFINTYPAIDKQKLRQLIRNAHKEQKLQKPPQSARKLFQFLKQHIVTE